jgi:hypothetical protein
MGMATDGNNALDQRLQALGLISIQDNIFEYMLMLDQNAAPVKKG